MDQNGLFEKGRNGQPFLGSAFVEQIQMIQCPRQCIGLSGYILKGLELVQQTVYSCSFHLLGPFSAIMSVVAGKLQPRHQLEHLLTILDPCHPQITHEIGSKDIGPGKSILHRSPDLSSEPNILRLQHPYGSADSETEGVASWVVWLVLLQISTDCNLW